MRRATMDEAMALDTKQAALSVSSAENWIAAMSLLMSCYDCKSAAGILSCSCLSQSKKVRLKNEAIIDAWTAHAAA